MGIEGGARRYAGMARGTASPLLLESRSSLSWASEGDMPQPSRRRRLTTTVGGGRFCFAALFWGSAGGMPHRLAGACQCPNRLVEALCGCGCGRRHARMAQQAQDETLHFWPLQPRPEGRRRRQTLEQRRRLLYVELLGRGGERGRKGGDVRGLAGWVGGSLHCVSTVGRAAAGCVNGTCGQGCGCERAWLAGRRVCGCTSSAQWKSCARPLSIP